MTADAPPRLREALDAAAAGPVDNAWDAIRTRVDADDEAAPPRHRRSARWLAVAAAVVADRGVVEPEALEQPECLREVARGHEDLVATPPQRLDHRAHHQHVRGVRQVDPNPHEARQATLRKF